MNRVGILGGTFDPPHLGHVMIAEEVRMSLDLDEVWFVPTNDPPHKKSAWVEGTQRFKMVKLAIDNYPKLKVHPIEIERTGKSYTVDTMRQLSDDHPTTAFYFIIGADMVAALNDWKAIDQLIEMVTFVGVDRYGYKLETPYPVTQVKIPLMDLSSTMIRHRLAKNQSVQHMLPPTVYEYIKEECLYEGR